VPRLLPFRIREQNSDTLQIPRSNLGFRQLAEGLNRLQPLFMGIRAGDVEGVGLAHFLIDLERQDLHRKPWFSQSLISLVAGSSERW
jgi:hypothetical protein